MTGVLMRKGKGTGTHTHTHTEGQCHVKAEAEAGAMPLSVKDRQGPSEARRRKGRFLPGTFRGYICEIHVPLSPPLIPPPLLFQPGHFDRTARCWDSKREKTSVLLLKLVATGEKVNKGAFLDVLPWGAQTPRRCWKQRLGCLHALLSHCNWFSRLDQHELS